MKRKTSKYTRCPKCSGSLFLDKDYYGWYEQCLQCGYMRNVNTADETAGIPASKLAPNPRGI